MPQARFSPTLQRRPRERSTKGNRSTRLAKLPCVKRELRVIASAHACAENAQALCVPQCGESPAAPLPVDELGHRAAVALAVHGADRQVEVAHARQQYNPNVDDRTTRRTVHPGEAARSRRRACCDERGRHDTLKWPCNVPPDAERRNGRGARFGRSSSRRPPVVHWACTADGLSGALRESCAIVLRHYRRPLTVAVVARALASSPRQVPRAFDEVGRPASARTSGRSGCATPPSSSPRQSLTVRQVGCWWATASRCTSRRRFAGGSA
jgi:hypothetical protein